MKTIIVKCQTKLLSLSQNWNLALQIPGNCLKQLVIWEEFELVSPDEVDEADKIFRAVNYVLDSCPSWLIKVSWEVTGD